MKIKNIITFGLIFLVLAIIHLGIKTANMNFSYKNENLKIEFNEIYAKNKKLAAETAQKSRLDRIEQIAKTKLDMERPETIKYIVASSETMAK